MKKIWKSETQLMCLYRALNDKSLLEKEPLEPVVDQPYKLVYINLAHREDRLLRLKQQLTKSGLIGTRFEALTTTNTPTNLVGEMWIPGMNTKYDKRYDNRQDSVIKMSSGERGCAGSHCTVWKIHKNVNLPLFILEDDAMFEDRILEIANLSVQKLSSMNFKKPIILYLDHLVGEWYTSTEKDVPNEIYISSLVKLKRIKYTWNLSAYILWPNTIEFLSSKLQINMPVDNWITQYIHNNNIIAYGCVPKPVRQFCNHCDGDIFHT